MHTPVDAICVRWCFEGSDILRSMCKRLFMEFSSQNGYALFGDLVGATAINSGRAYMVAWV